MHDIPLKAELEPAQTTNNAEISDAQDYTVQRERVRRALEHHEAEHVAISEQLVNLEKQMQRKQLEISAALENLYTIQDEIMQRDAHMISRLVAYNKLTALRTTAGSVERTIADLQKESDEVAVLLSEMRQIAADKAAAVQVDKDLEKFYSAQEQKLQEHREDQIARDVSNVAEKYDCIFVHGIAFDNGPQGNTPLAEGASWETKLDIVLGLSPEISTSTVRDGNKNDKIFAYRTGILLKGGHIRTAHQADSASQVSGLNRVAEQPAVSGKIGEQIKSAIVDKPYGYNELTVSLAEVAGIFIDVQVTINEDAKKTAARVAQERGIPLYFIDEQNQFHTAVANESGEVEIGKVVSLAEIRNDTFSISAADKEAARARIFQDSPFRMDLQDRKDVVEWSNGKKDFERNEFVRNILSSQGYVSVGPDLWRTAIENISDTKGYLDAVFDACQIKIHSTIPNDIASWQERLDHLPANFYTVGSKRYNQEQEELTAEKEKILRFIEEQKRSVETVKRKFAFFLDGFGKAAEEAGDRSAAQVAMKYANELVSVSEREELLARRVGTRGQFKITEDDLKAIKSGSQGGV